MLPATQYPNNSRIVSGTVSVTTDDSILLCDTTTAAVTINLQEIPAGSWNTNYKLYVADNNNNASANNITIVAPAGYLINGQPSITINTNKGTALIRINTDTSYIANLSSGTGTSGYTTIQDEGVALPQRTVLNFVGRGVTVTDIAGVTTATINGTNIINVTWAAINTLITNASIVDGQYYRITNAGGSDLGVIVQGLNTTTITTHGTGLFYNADYQGTGDYSGVTSFTLYAGIWTNETDVNSTFTGAGNVVTYNNLQYVNKTGTWSAALQTPATDTVNWEVLTKSITNGYILVGDFVRYDNATNAVVFRADALNNEVENGANSSLAAFQWGRSACYNNKVLGDSTISFTNSNCTIYNNIIQSAIFNDSTPMASAGNYNSNSISSGATVSIEKNQGIVECNRLVGLETTLVSSGVGSYIGAGCNVSNNDLSNASKINVHAVFSNSNIRRNTLSDGSIIKVDNSLYNTSNIDDNNLNGNSQIRVNYQWLNAFISNNVLANNSFVYVYTGSGINESTITYNYLNNGTAQVATMILSSDISYCDIENNIVSKQILSGNTYNNFSVRNGYSNWVEPIDCSTAIAGTTLTFVNQIKYAGIFVLTSCTGRTITKIVNAPSLHPFTLTPAVGETVTIDPVAVGIAVSGDVIASSATTGSPKLYTGRTDGTDSAYIDTIGANYGLINKNIWS